MNILGKNDFRPDKPKTLSLNFCIPYFINSARSTHKLHVKTATYKTLKVNFLKLAPYEAQIFYNQFIQYRVRSFKYHFIPIITENQ